MGGEDEDHHPGVCERPNDGVRVLRSGFDVAGSHPATKSVPLKRLDTEIASNYTRKPLFLRSIADHLAGMTDSYALAEYDGMVSAYPRRAPGGP